MQTDPANSLGHPSIELSRLRPTQLTVGMLEVKHKRRRLRELEKRPGELVDFILETPIRVVLGPAGKVYVIDHHHLGLALLKEDFQSAPMVVEADLSHLPTHCFWQRMRTDNFLHLVNAKGIPKPHRNPPKDLECLKDDPYRSLAGFVRAAGGYSKSDVLYAEFQWADFFRPRIRIKSLRKQFEKCVQKAVRLARIPAAAALPGYIGGSTTGPPEEPHQP
jgi:hypothetical protein